jgi:hypothetical protein
MLGLGATRVLRAVLAAVAIFALVAFMYATEANTHAQLRPARAAVHKPISHWATLTTGALPISPLRRALTN